MAVSRALKRKFINSKIAIVLSSYSEFTDTPLRRVEQRFIECDDKSNMIEDMKYIVSKIQDGTGWFDEEYNWNEK